MGSCLPEQMRLWLLQGVFGKRWLAWTISQCLLPLLGPRPGLGDTAPSSGEGRIWDLCALQSLFCREPKGQREDEFKDGFSFQVFSTSHKS